MLENKNIVCVSPHYWFSAWFRKQHFMSRFARQNRLLYVEPTVSMIKKADRKIYGNKFLTPKLERINENLFLLKPPCRLPKTLSDPFASKLNCRWFSKIINNAAKKVGMKKYLLWLYLPEYYYSLKYFTYKNLVFDMVDDLPEYYPKNSRMYSYISESVSGLVKKSDLVITTTNKLLRKYGQEKSNEEFCHVPNGVDLSLFLKEKKAPSDLKDIKRPIVGFVGVLFNWLDYDLIVHIADSMRECSLVLVGPINYDVPKKSIEEIKKRRNIYFLGKKPQEEIPNYIAQFDVGINPFKISSLSKNINPLKVYEYLACGKPVVSVRMGALEEEGISKEVDFAQNYKEFVDKVCYWIKNDSKTDQERRIEVVKDYSWDSLFSRLDEKCNSLFG